MQTKEIYDIKSMMHFLDEESTASPKEYGQYLQNKCSRKIKKRKK